MENNSILKSFDLQDDLNPKIWKKNSKGSYTLSPEVREKLLEIAYEFIESLKVDVIVSDVHLTGSLVNFNWSQYSDFDLHIIADFNQFPKKSLPLYEELFKLKKTIFNSEQNIKIYGYDVEVFVQDENEKGHSAGIFSLISNDWLEKPKKEKFEVNKTILEKKINQWTEKIDKVLESAQEEKDLEKSKKLVSNLKEKLKDYRKIGLEKGGEMSYENLVFKYLRRSGHIEKLFSFKKEKLDKELSLNESILNEMQIKDISGLSTYRRTPQPRKEYFMVHHTAGLGTAEGVVKVLNKRRLGVQWVVDVEGKIYRTLPSGNLGAHVGNNSRNRKVSNYNTEGVEVIGMDDADIKKRHDADIAQGILPRQAEAVRQIVKSLGYSPSQLIGHGEVSNNRQPSEGQTIIKYIRDNWSAPNNTTFDIIDSPDIKTTSSPEDENEPSSGNKIRDAFRKLFNIGQPKASSSSEKIDKESLVKSLEKINTSVSQSKGSNIKYDKNVEIIQKALISLGYELPEHGVDGMYGRETANAIEKFKKDNNITENFTPLKNLFENYINEVNTYGFPEGDVDSGKVLRGGDGGNWGGSMEKALEILSFAKDCKGDGRIVSSQKRKRVKTASGRMSDHYVGNLGAYAVDIPTSGKKGDELLACIMEKWNGGSNKDYKGGKWLNVKIGGYRYQFGWRVKNHYDHIHVGVKKIGSKVVDVDKIEKTKSDSKGEDGSKITTSAIQLLISKLLGTDSTPSTKSIETKKDKKISSEKNISELPNSIVSSISKLSDNHNVEITDEHINNEFEQEGGYYIDNGGLDNSALSSLEKLLNELYREFPDAEKPKNKNCNNVVGCLSGYRGYNTQVDVFAKGLKNGDVEGRQKWVTLPGFSQHHTGKAFDIISVNPSYWSKNSELKNWVANNVSKYGFKISYPTQGVLRSPEPWHIIYIG
jgi:LAS superfamily LD-carboxypeptidase LdcB/N-acetyl-anhydromuramyl-L-alanine amidase AmpD